MTDFAHPGAVPIPVRIIRRVSDLCGVIAALMILLSVFITCQMIFVRLILKQSTFWQTEAVIYLVIAATLLGLSYVQLLRGHVGVDLLPGLMPPGARRVLALFVLIMTLAMAAVMIYYGYDTFHLAWSRNWKSESVWGFPLWIPYLTVPLGFALFFLQLAADLWMTVTGRDNPLAPSMVPDIQPQKEGH
ncbi:TRAP transporter small permease [Puniceibacterium sediminis]|uniref:TRAP transporter small permease protein n=1 Tax=Puniceibacterium sediminis TaxID=1608407 RepID=A0A238WZA2_9RHOB|nr:TRAP transporter small permease [Puniceibacterium sediminis]SNR51748.1 TRAP-type C4-dicarboxylate transport system, small permease component [Puniceibacterium sediminis]